MSHDEDYTTNIDEQLLTAVKNQVNGHDLSGVKLEQKHQYPLHDDSEYNIQIPDPIVDSRLKIYPVNENTITNEGNLITRPFPEQMFHARDELNDFVTEFARDNGFGIVIAHSNKKAIYYTCELGGRYRHKKGKTIEQQEAEAQQRQLNETGTAYVLEPHARTKKLRCPFSMTALFRKLNLIWLLRTTCNEHNHPQLDPLLNHPMLRKRLDELNLLILDLYKVGTKPSHIEAKIKHQYPDVLIKREDIYNEIRGYKRKLKKQNKFLPGGVSTNGVKRRRNAALYHEVMAGDDDDAHDEVLLYELERQQQEAELHRHLHAAAEQAHMSHPHLHMDYQQLGMGEGDGTAAAAIAAVNGLNLLIDNIDSRLVGE